MKPPNEPHPFDEMVQQPERNIRPAHAALLWARDEHTDMTPAHYLDRLKALADRVDAENAATPSDRVDALRGVLVESESFRGNYDDFGNPENSYLNRVIDRRLGIPISLSLVWLDVAKQLDWPIVAVALPGHFLIRYDGMGDDLFVDPFNGGRELSRDDCATIMSTLFGKDFELREEHFAPAGPHTILTRMLGNLYVVYATTEDWPRAVHVLQRLIALRPQDAMVHAELGRLLILTGELKAAAGVLAKAEELVEDGEASATVSHHLNELRFRIRQQN